MSRGRTGVYVDLCYYHFKLWRPMCPCQFLLFPFWTESALKRIFFFFLKDAERRTAQESMSVCVIPILDCDGPGFYINFRYSHFRM